ncbi:MAG: efflux transporter periplasmic adaptor subunit [Alphaproteobacteria bacterium PA4]|nr:MAG: efflux transporter periplasmic adaptor subunit [Alphaproteobacteria bacterium PA4]
MRRSLVWNAGTFLLLAACSASTVPPQPPLVSVAIAVPAAAGSDSGFTGVVRARIEAAPGFRVGGKISARLVDAGQTVRAGQPLFRLAPEDYDLATAAAQDRVRAAQADVDRTVADERRLRGLVDSGAVSASAYDGIKAARDAAIANLAAGRANAASVANNGRYTSLLADADGVVTEILAESGQVVAAGTPVLRLARAGAREALVSIPETRVAGLPRRALALPYGGGAAIPAHLREVAGAADPVTRSFQARYVLESGAPPPLGTTITISLSAERTNLVAVPLAAVVDFGRGPGVWLIDADMRVKLVPVRMQRLTEESALVPATALPVGSRIVALGGHLLRAGQRVRLAHDATVRS